MLTDISSSSAAKIAILNKSDLKRSFNAEEIKGVFDAVLEVSARSGGEEIAEKLATVVDKLFTDDKISVGNEAIIASARQNAELVRAHELIESAIAAIRMGITQDAASSDIERALGAIAELDGKAVSEAVVADIFAKFCVGK